MKRKILGYCHAYPGSGFMAGGETTLHDLFRALVAEGWEAEVILSKRSRNNRGNYVIDGVEVKDFSDQHQINRGMTTASLAMSHLGGAQRTSLVARQNRIPSIHVVHNDLNYTKAMVKHAQLVVYNTLWVLDSFRNSPYTRPPGLVVRPPVEPTRYSVRSSRDYITLVNLADGDGGPYNKGPEMFYWLAEQFPDEKFLGVKGAYGNQMIRTDLPNVTIVENTEDIREVYRKTCIVLSPSNYESYGRISVEAACSGIPSITSLAPGFREHSLGAHLVDFQDREGWRTALLDVINHYSKYSKQSRVKANNLWEQSQRELQDFVSAVNDLALGRKQ